MRLNLNISISLGLLLMATSAFCQSTVTFKGVDSVVAIDQDSKGNYFLADQHFTLHKYDSSGKSISNVNIKLFGSIDKIDCSNPFEIYTYHKEQNIIVYYDNMLNIRGQTLLNDLNFTNIADIERSYDNGIWIFNLDNYTLQKIAKNGTVLAASYNLYATIGSDINIVSIKEFGSHVYLLDSKKGIHKFDFFGTYITTFYLDNVVDFDVKSKAILVLTKSQVLDYSTLSRDYDVLEIPIRENSQIVKGKVVAFKRNRLFVH